MDAYKNLLEVIPVFNIKCAMKSLQFLFFGLNLFYVVVGTLFITMFCFITWVSWPYSPFLGQDVINFSIIFIVIGVIMFIVSLFGGIVAVKESTLLANIYAVVMLLLLVVELNAAVTVFIMYSNVGPKIEMNMHKYLNNQTVQDQYYMMEKWNLMQQNLDCCGINHANDWAPLHVYGATVDNSDNDRYSWRGTTAAPRNTYTVPFSCCRGYRASGDPSHVFCENVRYSGCLDALSWRLRDALPVIAITTGVTLIMQLVGCIIAYLFAKVIRRCKTNEEMKKQELQHLMCKNLQQSQDDKEALLNVSES